MNSAWNPVTISTFIIAASGLSLTVYSFARDLLQRRFRMQVELEAFSYIRDNTALHGKPYDHDILYLGIVWHNESQEPLIISDVQIVVGDKKYRPPFSSKRMLSEPADKFSPLDEIMSTALPLNLPGKVSAYSYLPFLLPSKTLQQLPTALTLEVRTNRRIAERTLLLRVDDFRDIVGWLSRASLTDNEKSRLEALKKAGIQF